MQNKQNTKAKVIVIAIAILLCLALAVGITGAWYQAQRRATGTVKMDKGIVIDYTGFGKEADGIWIKENETTFRLFADTDVQPGEKISLLGAGIKANASSVDFYARVKLSYEFYNGETKVNLANPSDLITTSATFFGSDWVESGDGYYYYGIDTTMSKFKSTETSFIDLFAKDENGVVAKFIIEGKNFVGADAGQGGGFVVDGTTSINKIVTYLTLETLQGDATPEQAKALGWEITEKPIIENFSENKLLNSAGDEIDINSTDLVENATYQVVDESGNGYKFTYALNEENKTATITGPIGSPTQLEIPSKIVVNGKEYTTSVIAAFAFDRCTTLTTVTIGSGIVRIEAAAFRYCRNLTAIEIPNSVTIIGNSVFASCDKLTAITIPSSVTSIGDDAFAVCGQLTTIKIPDGIISIGATTFESCYKLTTIEIPSSVTSIGASAFASCNNLITIEIPSSVTSIGEKAFYSCVNLTTITIPSGVTSIGANTFARCSKLTTIEIPDSVTSIGSKAFYLCKVLSTIDIPSGVTIIGEDAFYSCGGLTSITVAEGNSVYHSAGNCLIETASKTLIIGCNNSIIPTDGSVTSIANNAFNGCSGLTEIIVPDGVTSIGNQVFYGCSGLTEITIPNSVISIGSWAFYNCSNLTSISIPDSVTSIESNAFYSCSSLATVIIDSSTIAALESSGSKLLTNAATVYVKTGLTVGSYITGSFTKQGSSDKTGYDMYTHN